MINLYIFCKIYKYKSSYIFYIYTYSHVLVFHIFFLRVNYKKLKYYFELLKKKIFYSVISNWQIYILISADPKMIYVLLN